MKLIKALIIIMGCLWLVSSAGCGAFSDYVDCRQVCERYRDCVDSNYDTGECIDRCYDRSRNDPAYNRDAHECNACLADRACAQSLACSIPCGGIVP